MLHTEILASFSRTFHKINQFHSHVQELKVRNSGGPQHNHTWRMNGWLQQKLPMFGFRTHTTALWPMEQSSILSAKFDCPETHQNCSLLATVHDCETGLCTIVLQFHELMWACACIFESHHWSDVITHQLSLPRFHHLVKAYDRERKLHVRKNNDTLKIWQ